MAPMSPPTEPSILLYSKVYVSTESSLVYSVAPPGDLLHPSKNNISLLFTRKIDTFLPCGERKILHTVLIMRCCSSNEGEGGGGRIILQDEKKMDANVKSASIGFHHIIRRKYLYLFFLYKYHDFIGFFSIFNS